MTGTKSNMNPRVCVCVLMNHPFPRNIPLLRRLYADRFSTLLFLMPLERMPDDPDVITIYRGSYVHAAYVTDAREQLRAISCDYFIFVHDDVLLNPSLDENSFRALFPLGPGDAYISRFGTTGGSIGHWTWLFGCAPKMLFPKSQLFGSGIEIDTLRKYLPPRQAFEESLSRRGLQAGSRLVLTHEAFGDVERQPSRVLLHGLSAHLPEGTPEQQEQDRICLQVEHGLVDALANASRLQRGGAAAPNGEEVVELPIPLLSSGYFADFYILPSSRLADFAHYIGVTAAANIFVELVVTSFLSVCCDYVWTADELGLDVSGFEEPAQLEQFIEPRFIAIHPFKFSSLNTTELQNDFFMRLGGIRQRTAAPTSRDRSHYQFLSQSDLDVWTTSGWHAGEAWGRWAAASPARLVFTLDAAPQPKGLEIVLIAPVQGKDTRLTGSASLNGAAALTFAAELSGSSVTLRFGPEAFSPGDNAVEIVSDRFIRPSDSDPGNQDHRPLGFGLCSLRFY